MSTPAPARIDEYRYQCSGQTYSVPEPSGDVSEAADPVIPAWADSDSRPPLVALHEETRALLQADSRKEAAQRLLRTIEDVLNHPAAVIRLATADDELLDPVAVSEEAVALAGERDPERVGETAVGTAYAEDRTIVVEHSAESPFPYDHGPDWSGLYVPISGHGAISIEDPDPGEITVTDRRLVELLAANAEAVFGRFEQERTAALQRANLDELTGLLSHDLKNLLNVVTGRVAMARQETGEDEHLPAAESTLQRIDAVIDDAVTLAREGTRINEWDRIPLADVVREVWTTAGSPDADLVVGDDLGMIACDRSGLQQLLENLIRNAVDHAGPAPSIVVEPLPDGFAVGDDGPGIAPDEADRIFESGYTTSDEGTGWGLAIVDSIAEAHDWTVTVTRSEAGGARFEIRDAEVTR
jgi:K+-sensing histidine kinase KdpD